MVGGMVETGGAPEWTFFLIGPGTFTVADTWFTVGMRATGSNTAVCDGIFVPTSRTMRLADLLEGKGPGGALHAHPIYRAPFISYAPLTFVTPMLGAAQGAYEQFRDWTKTRRGAGGVIRSPRSPASRCGSRAPRPTSTPPNCCCGAPSTPRRRRRRRPWQLRARTMRDLRPRRRNLRRRVIDTLMAMSGTAGFAASHPIQRAWRDIHFAAMHVSLNPSRTSPISAAPNWACRGTRTSHSSEPERTAPMDLQEEIGRLVAPLLHRKLFVCVSEPAVPRRKRSCRTSPHHLRHLVAMEKSGVLLASGPFIEGGEVGLRAMMIIRAKDADEAHRIAAEETLHKLGLRRFTIEEWQLNQGRISVQIDFSDQKAGLDKV